MSDGMAIIGDEDRAFSEEYEYVKLEGIVPEALCDRVIDDAWRCLGGDRDDPGTWYDPPDELDEPILASGMIELYHTQTMWDVRQHPRVYQAFTEFLGMERQ